MKKVDVLDNEDETETDANEGAVAVSEIKTETDSTVRDNEKVQEDSVVAVKTVSKPVAQKATPKKVTQPVAKTTSPANAKLRQYVYHVVQPGDTLWSIAQRYDEVHCGFKKVAVFFS